MTSEEKTLSETLNERPEKSRLTVWPWLLATFAVLLALTTSGWLSIESRRNSSIALAAETQTLSVATVQVTQPLMNARADELELPGNVEAYTESSIYSRTNGYVARWYKNIGTFVSEGELLAEIETPEVDQELAQARAAREQLVAALDLARTSAERWRSLRQTDSVSQQELDQKLSDLSQAQANLSAADANVRRLEQLESFKHIYAPFAGVITRRTVNVGALVNAGNGGSGQELYTLAQVDPLRVYVSVPETDAPAMRPGLQATIQVAALPGARFTGQVVRTANAIDPATRTLLTEINVPNKSGNLLSGSYAQVRFRVPAGAGRLTAPSNAMLFRAEGPRVAVVGPGDRIQLRSISIGRDLGTTLEILQGLKATDRIVVNPPDSLEEGQIVHVAKSS